MIVSIKVKFIQSHLRNNMSYMQLLQLTNDKTMNAPYDWFPIAVNHDR